MGKEFAERRVATGETASQAGTLPDFRPLRSAPASGVRGGRDHGYQRRESLFGQTSGGGKNQERDQGNRGDRFLKLRATTHPKSPRSALIVQSPCAG